MTETPQNSSNESNNKDSLPLFGRANKDSELSNSSSSTQAPNNQKEPEKPKRRIWKGLFWISFVSSFILLPAAAALFYFFTIYPTLPDAKELKEVTYQVPLKIVTQDNKLITEIGTKRRIPLEYPEIPERMTQAIISAEDENFFAHSGVDYKGIARAVYQLVTTGEKKSGGSTITMQVARNFFLTREKSYLRKLNEIILAYKIENELSKEEILALYLNKIFLGYRSYGVAAAAKTYYGRPISELTLDEYAMIAGLPKAPSAYNPIINPERAKLRRDYVLRRMHELNYINDDQLAQALSVEVHAEKHGPIIEVEADYIAEMARSFALENFGEEALQNGLTIVTTLQSHLQKQANIALRHGLQEYERRHGYRGPIQTLEADQLNDQEALLKTLKSIRNFGDLKVAVVTGFEKNQTFVFSQDGESQQIDFKTMEWAAPFISVNRKGKSPKTPQDVLKIGDVIYIQFLNEQWQLAQDPKTESALVSLDSANGQIQALVGGFDYFRSKFNRAIQGKRQVGSNIKPFLYSAALENGMTAATTVNDAPVTFYDRNLEEHWRPENYSGKFYGPTRLRKALALSRNLVSIRLLQQLGVQTGIDYFQRFGFPTEELNRSKNLSLSLGSVQFSPLEVARAYATFSNGGYLIDPHFIAEVRDFEGTVIYRSEPKTVCQTGYCPEDDPQYAPRVIEARNAYIMKSIMKDVVTYGSGRKARALKREDIAGKTGTTNDQKDAWFSGFNPYITTTVWVGFDEPSTLGRYEVGGRAALPIWMEYMQLALQPYPNEEPAMPEGIVTIPVNKETGQAVPADSANALYEIFREENAPEVPKISQQQLENIVDDLFD